MKDIKRVAIEAVQIGGKVLLNYYSKRAYGTHTKSDTSLQTEADIAAEQAIIEYVRAAFPDHSIESEEQGLLTVGQSPYRWRIDPLDGTENFVLGLPYFSSTLALSYDGRLEVAVVYEPITGNLYTAARGEGAWLNNERLHVSQTSQTNNCRAFLIPDFVTKRQAPIVSLRHELFMRCRRVLDTWSPALDWCLVSSGKADLVIAVAGQPIIPNAGILMLEEAGGRITDFYGQAFTGQDQCYLIGSNSTELHTQLLKLIKYSFSER